MLARLASWSRSPWFRIPTLLFAALLSVVMGPWMVVAVLAAPLGIEDGQVLASASLGAMGAAGLLGLVGLWLALLLPARVVNQRRMLGNGLAALLAIGSVAALVGAAWSAAGAVCDVAAGFLALALAGGMLWIGVFEGRRAGG